MTLTFFGVVDTIKIMNTITIPKNLIKTKSEDRDIKQKQTYGHNRHQGQNFAIAKKCLRTLFFGFLFY